SFRVVRGQGDCLVVGGDGEQVLLHGELLDKDQADRRRAMAGITIVAATRCASISSTFVAADASASTSGTSDNAVSTIVVRTNAVRGRRAVRASTRASDRPVAGLSPWLRTGSTQFDTTAEKIRRRTRPDRVRAPVAPCHPHKTPAQPAGACCVDAGW